MLEETYLKFEKNILPKMKKMQPNFQEPVVEYCEPEQVIVYAHITIIQYLINQIKSKTSIMMIMIYTTHQNLNTNSNTESMKTCLKLNN